MELIGELVTRAAGTGSERVAALDHEVRDDPVEDRAVIEPGLSRLAGRGGRPPPRPFSELHEIKHCPRCMVRKEPDDYGPPVCPPRRGPPGRHKADPPHPP